ncbi:uncharacterized protein Dwil_GK16807 [Drosophila willistoni]|uniref:Peptidase M14 domain-containing protein n=1 Tax=Drosophila willistoni TaxID=7260 RepID=B4ML73_DROWI|nr:carboxypeptidase B [Drosophila willistoni]EDW73131.2 uncharacterized protein Dwil_GK16807 [Drosophila willistoni]
MQTMVKSKRSTKNNKAKSREAAHRIWASAALTATPARRLIIPRPDVLHNYLEYKQINQYLEYLANRYPKFVKLYTLGLSAERREIRALDINWLSAENLESKPPSQQQQVGQTRGPVVGKGGEQSRNIVFIEAGTHGREWISITTALNCIYQVTERYTRNIEILRKLRFIIVPVVNPDGYEYSRTKNPNWRKNRRTHKSTKFVGTDCNRNYDIFWDSGTSKMNRNTYKGERPFSEPETRAMRNLLDRLESNLLFFLSLHSYGQSIMYPWGYTREPPHFWRELHTLATCGRTAIKSYNGREYRTGSISCLTKRTISGSVVDYVYGVLRTPMALVMELPSRELGFQPPMENISQIGHESWFGIREMCKRAYDLRHQINRTTEPKLPRPAGADAPALLEGGDGERVIAATPQSISSSNATDGGGDNAEKKTKTTPKKGKRRLKRPRTAQHGAILEIHRSLRRPLAAASGAGTAAGAAAVPHKRLLATKSAPPIRRVREGATTAINPSTPPPNASRAGHGDGPLSVRGKNPRAATFTPLGVFL